MRKSQARSRSLSSFTRNKARMKLFAIELSLFFTPLRSLKPWRCQRSVINKLGKYEIWELRNRRQLELHFDNHNHFTSRAEEKKHFVVCSRFCCLLWESNARELSVSVVLMTRFTGARFCSFNFAYFSLLRQTFLVIFSSSGKINIIALSCLAMLLLCQSTIHSWSLWKLAKQTTASAWEMGSCCMEILMIIEDVIFFHGSRNFYIMIKNI